MPTKTLFARFGHRCEIKLSFYDVPDFHRSHSIKYRILNFIQRSKMINETNKRAYYFLKSQKRIENEWKRQLVNSCIHPFSKFIEYWQMFMIIILTIQFIMVPLPVSAYLLEFDDIPTKSLWFNIIRFVTDAVSFLDLILKFCTGYCNDKLNVVVMDPSKIARRYLLANFLIDLYSSIPGDQIINIYNTLFSEKIIFILHYLQLLKLYRIRQFHKYVNVSSEVLGFNYVYVRIIQGMFSYVILVHVLCCSSMALTAFQLPWQKDMIMEEFQVVMYGAHMTSFVQWYCSMYYSSCLILLNSGYGSNCDSNASRLHTVFMWITSRLLFIFTIAYFMSMHISMFSSQQNYANMICEVQDYMKHRQVPTFLQKRIVCYYDIKFKSSYYQEEEILNTISSQLMQEITMHNCRRFIENITFFKDLPIVLLLRIESFLRIEIFLTNDVIVKCGTMGEDMYFIANGSVAIYTKSGKEICHLEDGDYFGEISIVTNYATVATVIAAEVCELYRLKKKDFMKCIVPFPKLYKKISEVANCRRDQTEILDKMHKAQMKTKI